MSEQHSSNGPNAPQNPIRIIVHSMAEYLIHEGKKMHAPDFINAIGLSAHAFVCPDGQVIRQREDTEGAWHAKGWNKDSLGVEILVPGTWEYGPWLEEIKTPWCNHVQFYAAAGVVAQWARRWSIMDIRRHSDVDPDRKYDPGAGFDWDTFLELVETAV